jgi:hypothetical protein
MKKIPTKNLNHNNINMETIETLDEKINDIKNSAKYQNLIIKHRGPQEVAMLRDLMMRIDAFEQQKRFITQPLEINSALTPEHGVKILSPPRPLIKNSTVKAKPKLMAQPYHKNLDLPDVPPEDKNPPPIKNITPFCAPGKAAPVRGVPQVLPAAPGVSNAQKKGMAPPPPIYPIIREKKQFTTVNKAIARTAVTKAQPPKIVSNSLTITAPPKQVEQIEPQFIREPDMDETLSYESDEPALFGDYDDI